MTEADAKERALKYPVRTAILHLTGACAPGKSVTPTDVAKTVSPKHWKKLLSEVKAETIKLAKAGSVTMFRKGRPIAADDFKGVYRIGRPQEDENEIS